MCTNFSTRAVELRSTKRREILHFLSLSFLLSPLTLTLSFPSLSFFSFFISYELFFLLSLFFFLFFPFCFYPTNSFILFFFHLFFSSSFSHHFFWDFSPPFGWPLTVWVKGGNFLLISSCQLVWPFFFLHFSFISYFFYDITLPCGSL